MTNKVLGCVAVMGLVGLMGCAREARVEAVRAPAASGPASAPPAAEVDTAPEHVSGPPKGIAGIEQMCESAPTDSDRRELYTKACNAHDGEACAKLGALYTCGRGVVKNAEVGLSLMDRSCAAGYDKGCYVQASLLVDGTLVPQDVARGVALLDKDCARGRMASCETAGVLRLVTESVAVQRHGAALLDKSCAGGVADACANLGVVEAKGLAGRSVDFPRAFALMKRACEGKSLQGCTTLASMYVSGTGTAKNEALGAQIFDAACQQGRADACLGLAKCQYNGVGVHEDHIQAIGTLRRACDGNNGEACRLLADAGASARSSTSYASPLPPGVL